MSTEALILPIGSALAGAVLNNLAAWRRSRREQENLAAQARSMEASAAKIATEVYEGAIGELRRELAEERELRQRALGEHRELEGRIQRAEAQARAVAVACPHCPTPAPMPTRTRPARGKRSG